MCCAGLCRHVYRSHILGLAGSFSQGQLADLERCLPLNFVDYIEEDVKVMLTLFCLMAEQSAYRAAYNSESACQSLKVDGS